MTKFYEHLEFDKIKRILADYCHSSRGKELASALAPVTKLDGLKEKQLMVSELQNLLCRGTDFDFSHLTPVEQLFKHYAHQSYNYEEFTAVYFIAKTSKIISESLLNNESVYQDLKVIRARISSLSNLAHIVERYEKIFSGEGEVLDSASNELKSIRKNLIKQRQIILDTLQKTLQNKAFENLVQDKIVTQRDDRYVIPLKEGATSTLPGIIHSSSGSRATIYVEPVETVQMNNELHHLRQAEQEEIFRIFCEYTADIQVYAEELMKNYETLTELDFYFGIARMGNKLGAKIPRLINTPTITLKEARHPLLILSMKGVDKVIPFDLELGKEYNLLILSGPNTGGKTVTLKTVGLLTLMALSGLPITANEDSEIGLFSHIIADIGDQQSLEDSLSTFSAHLKAIHTMLQIGNDSTLILIDEIGAATDPEQGAALAQAVLEELDRRKIKGIVTTHYTPLKIYALNSESCLNAAMQFDNEKHLPTYQFKPGTPGNSFALEIASKLGFDDEILQRAKALTGSQNYELTHLLTKLSEERRELAISRFQYDLKRKLSEQKAVEYEGKLIQLEEDKKDIRKKALQQAQEYLNNIQNEFANEIKNIEQLERTEKKKAIGEVSKKVALKSKSITEEQQTYTIQHFSPLVNPNIGEVVWVKDLDDFGTISSIEKSGIRVNLDGFFLTTDINNLFIASKKKVMTKKENKERQMSFSPSSAKTELKVIGLTFDEALPMIENFLDQGYSAGLKMLRIVHGKGTGVLRKKIRQYLTNTEMVKDHYSPAPEAGGDGVTVVVI